jgi:hypothetical protein
VRLPSASDVGVLNWYVPPERVPFLRELIKAPRRAKIWWIGFPADVPEWFELCLGFESGVARTSSYDSQWVPGLFQNVECAEALYRAGEQRLTRDRRQGPAG